MGIYLMPPEVVFGEPLNFRVGVHECRHGSDIVLLALKILPKLLQTILLTVTIAARFVYPLSQNFPSHLHDIYNTLQGKEMRTRAIHRASGIVFPSFIYFLAGCRILLGGMWRVRILRKNCRCHTVEGFMH